MSAGRGLPGTRAPSAPGRPRPGARPWRARWRCCCSRWSCTLRRPPCGGGSTPAPACPAPRRGCARLQGEQTLCPKPWHRPEERHTAYCQAAGWRPFGSVDPHWMMQAQATVKSGSAQACRAASPCTSNTLGNVPPSWAENRMWLCVSQDPCGLARRGLSEFAVL